MSAVALLKLALVPFVIWLASLAARRWGHSVSGYLGGLPMIGAPITLFLALDLGTEFAARSALFTLGAVVGQGAHLLTITHVGQRRGWAVALASGWAAFIVAALAIGFVPLNVPLAAAIAFGTLFATWRWLPREQGDTSRPTIPPMELRLRLVAAFALACFIVYCAPIFGPVASGVLLSMPITGSITPPFTLARYGPGALVRLTRGFVLGLFGFSTFFLVVAMTATAWGVAASFTAALAGALAAAWAANRVARSRPG